MMCVWMSIFNSLIFLSLEGLEGLEGLGSLEGLGGK